MDEKQREAMMKAWVAAGTPGKPHELLGRMVGSWDVQGRLWMEGPEGPISESRGTVETRWLLPGLWIQDQVRMEMMGRPFQGYGVTGYDNLKKKYVAVWCDSLGTALLTMEGNLDAEGGTLALFGVANDPVTGEQDKLMGYLTHLEDADHHRFEIRDYGMRPEGARTMELAYTRRK
ncbi:MAG: DUF1579 domain-containing protein [Deferrisomatales bacterium]